MYNKGRDWSTRNGVLMSSMNFLWGGVRSLVSVVFQEVRSQKGGTVYPSLSYKKPHSK